MPRFLHAAAVAAAIGAGAALLASPALAVKGGPKNAAQDSDIDALQADIGFLLLQHARLVFVTEGTFTGALFAEAGALGLTGFANGHEAGDAICQDEAEAAGLVGNFTAWLSDGSGHAVNRVTDPDLPYILVDTTAVAHDLTDLTDTGADNTVDLDAFAALQAGLVWTGTVLAGTSDGVGTHCVNWQNDSSGENGLAGDSSMSGAAWTIGGGNLSCSEFHHLYCFQQ